MFRCVAQTCPNKLKADHISEIVVTTLNQTLFCRMPYQVVIAFISWHWALTAKRNCNYYHYSPSEHNRRSAWFLPKRSRIKCGLTSKNICLSASAKEIIWSWRNGCIGFERCEEGHTTSQGQELNKGNLEGPSISLHWATLALSLFGRSSVEPHSGCDRPLGQWEWTGTILGTRVESCRIAIESQWVFRLP